MNGFSAEHVYVSGRQTKHEFWIMCKLELVRRRCGYTRSLHLRVRYSENYEITTQVTNSGQNVVDVEVC